MKRVSKIFIPYWLVTMGIVIADYLLWQKQYPMQDLLLTFAGINISTELQYFDHSRWFITLLLLNYLLFFFCAKYCKPPYATTILILFSFILILLTHYDLLPLGAARHQLLAFPLGCLLAIIRPINRWNKPTSQHQIVIIILIALTMASINLVDRIHTDSYYLKKTFIYLESYALPYLFCLLCVVSISLLASLGYTSRLLGLFGCLSYELYLIHGPLLIKFNPIIGNFENGYILLGIFLWLVMALGLAYVLKAGTSKINILIHSSTG